MSVRLMTPVNRPEMLPPGIAAAVRLLVDVDKTCDPVICGSVDDVDGPVNGPGGGTMVDGVKSGVGGPDDAGDGDSTIHILCDFVATSLATVCAKVDHGFT